MRVWKGALWACFAAAFSLSCSATTRHRVLSTFFDGVPPEKAPSAQGAPGASPAAATVTRRSGFGQHGPYAAGLCGACHESGATNALVVPKDELCLRCHQLRLDKKYVHGPIASGGCLVCHDPHSSRYRFLLLSDSDRFCFHCHDRESLTKIEGHGGTEEKCTECHDAHMSDQRYLLK